MMSWLDEDYAALRAMPPDRWLAWLNQRTTDTTAFHWWLAMVESAETDLVAAIGNPGPSADACAFIVRVLEYAVSTGGWRPPYATGTMCKLAYILDTAPGGAVVTIPDELTPEGAVSRALASFPLTPDDAVAAAARERYNENEDALVGDDWRSWQDISWALYFVHRLADRIHSTDLSAQIAAWARAERLIVSATA